MKSFAITFASMSLLAVSCSANAFDDFQRISSSSSSDVQACYGFAMVGMDSVINSRLGVPAEMALNLARQTNVSMHGDAVYSTELLSNIYNAYIWDGSPHSYAIQVFFQCAQKSRPLKSASASGEN